MSHIMDKDLSASLFGSNHNLPDLKKKPFHVCDKSYVQMSSKLFNINTSSKYLNLSLEQIILKEAGKLNKKLNKPSLCIKNNANAADAR